VPPTEADGLLKGRRLDAIIHLGAISETTATDGDLVIETNFRMSMRLLDWARPCCAADLRVVGGDLCDGEAGFCRRSVVRWLKKLRPMNLYGWSKHRSNLPGGRTRGPREAAAAAMGRVEFFNVFGPNDSNRAP